MYAIRSYYEEKVHGQKAVFVVFVGDAGTLAVGGADPDENRVVIVKQLAEDDILTDFEVEVQFQPGGLQDVEA